MTNAQIEAFKEISLHGDTYPASELNIALRTVKSMARKGWIAVDGNKAFITETGHAALTKAGF